MRASAIRQTVRSLKGIRAHHSTLQQLFADPLWDPVAVRLSRFVAQLAPVGGESVRGHIAAAILACAPAMFLMVGSAPTSVASLVLWSTNCYLMIWFPQIVWRLLQKATPAVDAMFSSTTTPTLQSFSDEVVKYLSNRRQVLWSISVGAIVSAAFELARMRAGENLNGWRLAAYFAVGAFVGHSAYLITITGRLCRWLSRTSNLALTPIAHLSTPGLVLLSEAMRRMAQLGMILCLTCTAALTVRYLDAPSLGALWVTGLAGTVGLAFVILIGILSQGWIAQPAAEGRRILLGTMALAAGDKLSSLESQGFPHGVQMWELNDYLIMYKAIATNPTTFTDRNLLTSYIAAIFGIAVQLLLAGLFGLKA
jgi:hypothetical protein